jgi:nucleotide-binding universal stress UspA family protein
MITFKKILVPVDFGESSEHALETAIDLAKSFDGAVTIVHTWEVPPYAYSAMGVAPMDLHTPMERGAREALDALLQKTREQFPRTEGILKQGVAWREILSAIDEVRPDVVVMGTHGRRGVDRALLGSVAEKVVRMSPVAVLTVHAKAASAG